MNDWLSEIEGYPRLQDIKRLARVIRELVVWSKMLATHPDFDGVSVIWESLSPDAKELLK